MKTLHRYLLKQVIASLVMTVVVFTFVLLLGSALRELLPLLVSQRATLGLLAQAVGLLIPFVAAFALPIGMLTATLLVFGRFSADQELTAARASGISLLSLAGPILVLSLLLCGVSAAVNLEIAPRSKVAYNRLRAEMKEALSGIRLPAGRPITEFKDYVFYIGKSHDHQLEDVRILALKNGTNLVGTYRAASGQVEINTTNQQVILHLYDVKGIAGEMPLGTGGAVIELSLNPIEKTEYKPAISDMTFPELRALLSDLEHRISLPLSLDKTPGQTPADRKRALKRQRGEILEPIRVQIHREVAFSFACFGFTLVGIPLGIRVHRRETNIGVAIALGLVLIYYMLLIVGESLSSKPQYAPHLLVWVPNFIFQAVGAVLLWRANRGI